MGTRAGTDGCRKSRTHRNSIPGPFKPAPCSYTDYAISAHCIFPTTLHILCDFKHYSTHFIKLPQKVIYNEQIEHFPVIREKFYVSISLPSPRHVGGGYLFSTPGRLIVRRPVYLIFFQLFRPRTRLAKLLWECAPVADNFRRNPFACGKLDLLASYFLLVQRHLGARYRSPGLAFINEGLSTEVYENEFVSWVHLNVLLDTTI